MRVLTSSAISLAFVAPSLPAGRDRLLSKLAVAEAVAEAMSDATVLVDALGHILRFSTGFLALWGISHERAQQLPGTAAINLLASKLTASDELIGAVQRAHQKGEPVVAQLHLRSDRVLEARLVFVCLDESLGRVGVWAFRDVTEAWNEKLQLRAARDRAEQSVRAMRDALANINHELRTPLNAVVGFGRVLERSAASALSEKQQRHLAGITEAGERMLRLVDDLVELRAVEETRLELDAVDVGALVREAAASCAELARARGIAVGVATPDAPQLARANRAALSRALDNLLANALKLTPEAGEIALAVRTEGANVELSIRDTGCGIAPEDQPHLFDYVERVGGKHAHHMKGSGIGLALVKALVTKQHGTIRVESALGQGTTFTVALKSVA